MKSHPTEELLAINSQFSLPMKQFSLLLVGEPCVIGWPHTTEYTEHILDSKDLKIKKDTKFA